MTETHLNTASIFIHSHVDKSLYHLRNFALEKIQKNLKVVIVINHEFAIMIITPK